MIEYKKNYKTVLMPIDVPDNDYCWDNEIDVICPHFSNPGAHPQCAIGFDPLKYDKERKVPKPPNCSKLEEIE